MILIQLARHFPTANQKIEKSLINQGVGAAKAYPPAAGGVNRFLHDILECENWSNPLIFLDFDIRKYHLTARGTIFIMIGMEHNTRKFLAECRAIWREENTRSFDGELKRMPYFAVLNHKEWHAMFTLTAKGFPIISVKAALADQPRKLRSIIVHEMIHQQQAQHKSVWIRKEHHGRFFKRRVLEILCSRGLYIQTTYA